MSGLYRIVYVTGMKPKPPPDEHRAELVRALTAGLERVRPTAAAWLAAHPDRFVLVSWTHLLYGAAGALELILPGLERLLESPLANAAERREIDSLRRRLKRRWHLLGEALSPLTKLFADENTELMIADVRRYLDNANGVGVAIRALLKSALEDAWQSGDQVLLIGHSLGSVIAYDCLWELSRTDRNPGRVDQLVTLGSPLATRFIRRELKGAAQPPPARYPGNIRRWANFTARGEMVALHPRLEPYFRDMVKAGLVEAIEDHVGLYNHFHEPAGINPHRSYGYLIHEEVAALIGDRLSS